MFQLVATICFAFTCFIWSSKDVVNVLFKMFWAAMMFWAAFETLKAFGYVVKGA